MKAAEVNCKDCSQNNCLYIGLDNQINCIYFVALKKAPQRHDTPAKAVEWVGLTDEEIFEVHKQVDSMQYLTFGQAIEAKLKEKNT